MGLIRTPASIASIGLALALLATGCASHHYYTHNRDRAIGHEVVAALNSQPYNYPGVTVSSSRGVIELDGYVNTPDQTAQAAAIAASTPGVRRVDNRLTVVAPTGRTPVIVQPYPPVY